MNSFKLKFCKSKKAFIWASKIVSLIFNAKEVFRRNVSGGKSKKLERDAVKDDINEIRILRSIRKNYNQ